MSKKRPIHIDIVEDFKPGDPPPENHAEWQEWAQVQLKAGILQKRCPACKRLRFPNEKCACEAET